MQSRSDFGWNMLNVTADTIVHTGPGCLHTIIVNVLQEAEAEGDTFFEVYDGVDATGTLRGTVYGTQHPVTLIYDAEFTVGLFIDVTEGGQEEGVVDLTVTWI